MRTPTISRRLLMALLGSAAPLGLFIGGFALAADPDFSTVSDILGGKRLLLPIDQAKQIIDRMQVIKALAMRATAAGGSGGAGAMLY
jgi:hypothetical protein